MFYYICLSNWLLLLFHFGWLCKITFFNSDFICNIVLKSAIGVKLLSLCWKQCVKFNVFLLKTQLKLYYQDLVPPVVIINMSFFCSLLSPYCITALVMLQLHHVSPPHCKLNVIMHDSVTKATSCASTIMCLLTANPLVKMSQKKKKKTCWWGVSFSLASRPPERSQVWRSNSFLKTTSETLRITYEKN